MTSEQWRAEFDIEIRFSNGGGLTAVGFRLDVDSARVTPEEIGAAFVRELGLLMVGSTRVSNIRMLAEPHKGRRSAAAAPVGRRIVELSHRIGDGTITYPGLPGPQVGSHLTREASEGHYAPGTSFEISRITMVGNTGTYLDAPYHRFADGADLADLPAECFADLEGLLVRVTGQQARAVDRDAFLPYDVAGRAVLVHTGWDVHFGTERYGAGDHPYLTADAVAYLVEAGATLVGIDSVNVDDTADGARPAHTGLLAARIPIVEHLTGLDQLPVTGFRFHAAPPRIERLATSIVRAYAVTG